MKKWCFPVVVVAALTVTSVWAEKANAQVFVGGGRVGGGVGYMPYGYGYGYGGYPAYSGYGYGGYGGYGSVPAYRSAYYSPYYGGYGSGVTVSAGRMSIYTPYYGGGYYGRGWSR